MAIRVAINGFGRIGRNILRALYESGYRDQIQIVAINDLGDAAINAHLLSYDSVHGRFNAEVSVDNNALLVNGDVIRIYAERDPSKLPWDAHQVDVVYECTGLFTSRDKAAAHLSAGAKKVIISAPAAEVDATIVHGINHHLLNDDQQIISMHRAPPTAWHR